ncbi:MAG: hypothetical protein A3B08_03225 [Candidatus Taylorbacteria bacterium RIFCSPLOWO2_01_FULL_43_44]|uniref:Uncharacterized protein n=1 Tax=Candidatus Taylorbacteria bacterium RIFCSPHIGHO2_02_FULL_43_32b TaxID=1802306 RepID=A0A1G2MGU6_9BACT|nr:MAG: hypothetical protein A2743_02495 [Candidatus Taylorbacteria bacterium RIFCSPHIGHO2_01_FULL_43_47]OHA22261.1 MAG: hypothetical protein A3C72_04170 [Candidatus Taylorbacteria bacterium RIFCSPHIGHO2_02_FULL_43_32b]OHA29604.1 MAG: hypothetical protein A3B08_03225 [Candidatus Taylorbacteria bacterium RIFCSPLOWO2_01_FULL_43_44]
MYILMPTENLQPSSDFNVRVMRRVRLVYYTRKFINPLVIEFCFLVVLSVSVAGFVSVPRVISNSPSFINVSASGKFWVEAFQATELSTQGLALGIIVVSVLLLSHSVKIYRVAKTRRVLSRQWSPVIMQRGVRL